MPDGRQREPDPVVVACADARRERGLSVEDVAVAIGSIPRTVRRWEAGLVIPPLDRAHAYAAAVGMALSVGPGTQDAIASRRRKRADRGICRSCGKDRALLVSGGLVHHSAGTRYTPSFRPRCPGTGYPPAPAADAQLAQGNS